MCDGSHGRRHRILIGMTDADDHYHEVAMAITHGMDHGDLLPLAE